VSSVRPRLARRIFPAVSKPNLPPYFEIIGKRGFYRPVGRVSFEQGTDMIMVAITAARSLKLGSLVVNALELTGHAPPTVFGRHALAVKLAQSAGSELIVAFVVRPEMIDPQRIGIVMAHNRGVTGEVFTSEASALAWLDTRATRPPGKP
jgi:hypothetical protein